MDDAGIMIGRGLRIVFWIVGGLTLIVGLIMFFVPEAAGVGSAPPTAAPAGDQWWPWPLRTALNTRFLGALFSGVGVGAIWAARQRYWRDVRGLFAPGLTFTALATLAALLHWASFNSARIATWLFFGLYIAVLVAGLTAFIQYERKYKQHS